MNELLSIIQVLKDLTPKKIMVLLLSGIILIAVWKFDSVVDTSFKLYERLNKDSQEIRPIQSRLIFDESSDIGVSVDNKEIIKSYVVDYLSKFPSSVYSISVFKFLPPGESYAYQGRALIVFKSKDMDIAQEGKFLRELNVHWMPIWSGKHSVESLLNGLPVTLIYNDTKNVFFDPNSIQDVTPSSNFSLLHEVGVKSIYRHPIILNERVIGYISIYFNEKLNPQTEKETNRIAGYLNSRIASYLK